jgi:hypothetical protein
MSDSVWNAFFVIALIGLIVGALTGAGILGGLALLAVMFVAVAVFVIWTVTMLDPDDLANEPSYKGVDAGPPRS